MDGCLVGGNLGGPCYGDSGKGLRDEKVIPGVGLPGAVGVNVEGPDGRTDKLCQLDDAWFGDLSWTARAVGGNGAVTSAEVSAAQVAQTGSAIARTGAANGDEAEPFDCTGNQFAVEALTDEDSDATVAKSPRRGEQAAVPEGIDGRRRSIVAGKNAGIADVFITQRGAEAADDSARNTGNDSEGDALFQRIRRGHEEEFTFTAL